MNMKKSLVYSLILLSSACAWGKTFKVYSTAGNVSKKEGASWTALAKSGTVTDATTIKINPASSIRILDAATRQIYTFSSPGEFSVGALVKQSAKENSSLTGKIGAESRRQMAASSTKSHQAVGAATRATLDEELLEALYTSLVNGFGAGKDVGQIRLVKNMVDGDDLFTLSVVNESSEPVYVNVFAKSGDEPWSAVFSFSNDESALLVPPGATIAMDHILLAAMPGDQLVAVGFDQPFEAEELNDMFAEGFEPGETAAENVSLYFIK